MDCCRRHHAKRIVFQLFYTSPFHLLLFFSFMHNDTDIYNGRKPFLCRSTFKHHIFFHYIVYLFFSLLLNKSIQFMYSRVLPVDWLTVGIQGRWKHNSWLLTTYTCLLTLLLLPFLLYFIIIILYFEWCFYTSVCVHIF